MKLIEFVDDKGRKVFINPEKVSYVMEHKKGDLTYLYLDSTRADAQIKIFSSWKCRGNYFKITFK